MGYNIGHFPWLKNRANDLLAEFPDRKYEIADVVEYAIDEANAGESVMNEETHALEWLDELEEEWRNESA